jgi:hypothetical protein
MKNRLHYRSQTAAKRLLFLSVGTATVLSILVYNLHYRALKRVFTFKGDVVDEMGNPLDTGVSFTEGQFISATKNSYRTNIAVTPNGKFAIKTDPCSSVSLDFGLKGYRAVHLSFGIAADVPGTLHVVMYRDIPASAPVLLSPVGKFEINVASLHWSGSSYLSLVLNLNADGTATTVTKLADNKTLVNGNGTWAPSPDHVKDRITVLVKLPEGAPDPEHISGQSISLDLSDDGLRLIQRRGGPWFKRIE